MDGKCPHCGLEVQHVSEVNYFFRLSKYQDALLAWYEQHPDFVQPQMRYNELVNVMKGGLRDVSVSRSTVKWGVPVPFDTDQTVYVWFDALINYATVAGYGTDRFAADWPADLHLIGKDITRFHGIIWPAMLMALNVPLPRHIFAHGFWNFEGEKMSKSLGNVVDPAALIENLSHLIGIDEPMAVDALRYYLCREGTYGLDVDFSSQRLLLRFNTDLANDLGNLLNRTLNMFAKFRPQIDGQPLEPKADCRRFVNAFGCECRLQNLKFVRTREDMVLQCAQQDDEDDKPWRWPRVATPWLAPPGDPAAGLCRSRNLVEPCMPTVSDRLLGAINRRRLPGRSLWQGPVRAPHASSSVCSPHPAEQLDEFWRPRQPPGSRRLPPRFGPTTALTRIPGASRLTTSPGCSCASARSSGERVPETDKLVKLLVKVGTEERTIVAGIGKHYDPVDLVGKQIVIVANLQPRKLKGITSQGMLLAASVGDDMALLTPMAPLPDGAEIH